MKGLLVLVLLTGPWFFLLLLFPVAIWLSRKAMRKVEHGGKRLAVGLAVFLMAMLLPFGDEIAGRIYLRYLCSTKAGVRIHETVTLRESYWDERGRPTFIKGRGALDGSVLIDYHTKSYTTEYSKSFRIRTMGFQYVETSTRKVVGEVITFAYMGGWIYEYFSATGGGAACDRSSFPDSREILLTIFKRASSEQK